jgi:hypothetical protein
MSTSSRGADVLRAVSGLQLDGLRRLKSCDSNVVSIVQVDELLRHFWSLIPVNTQAKQEKLERIQVCIMDAIFQQAP